MGQTEFWNNHSAAVTIAGHYTNDLFKWSKRFLDEDDIRFTWLVTPRVAEEGFVPEPDTLPFARANACKLTNI